MNLSAIKDMAVNGNNDNISIVAVVVTYNRIKLLKENIVALLGQTIKCDILIIDNGSTDGTEEYVRDIEDERILYFNTGANLGGAGGFAYGVKLAEETGYDFMWIMDDDSIPEKDALQSLLNKARNINYAFSFLSSTVYWTDGTLCLMNLPDISYKNANDASIEIISNYKIMPINKASFVGCFVNTSFSKSAGLPIAEFFIYGDDFEYTGRLKKYAPAYLDLDSIIIHKAPTNSGAEIATASEDRIARFYFQSRNGMYTAKKQGVSAVFNRFIVIAKRTYRIITKSKNRKITRLATLYRGSIAGLFFNPKIKYSNASENQGVE